MQFAQPTAHKDLQHELIRLVHQLRQDTLLTQAPDEIAPRLESVITPHAAVWTTSTSPWFSLTASEFRMLFDGFLVFRCIRRTIPAGSRPRRPRSHVHGDGGRSPRTYRHQVGVGRSLPASRLPCGARAGTDEKSQEIGRCLGTWYQC